MPDYRWGGFLADPEPDRHIGFGDHKGEPVWQRVPGDYRAALRRLIVIQGDTEPASDEQQRHPGRTCPSGYDLRNLFQINVEEGRHLWAMVYLLHAHFGRDGREEAQALLAAYQDKQRDAEREAADILAHAEAEAERLRAEAEQELAAAVRRRTDAAMAKIDQAEAQALAEVREAAVELAVAATRTMLVDNLDRARGDALIDTAIGELRRKLH